MYVLAGRGMQGKSFAALWECADDLLLRNSSSVRVSSESGRKYRQMASAESVS